jgi:membrane-bound lytic murein transglycosylase A
MRPKIRRISFFGAVLLFLGPALLMPLFLADAAVAIEKLPMEEWPVFGDDGNLSLLADAVSSSIVYYERLPGERAFSFGSDVYRASDLAAGLRRFRDFLETCPGAGELDEFIRANGSVYAYREMDRPVEVLFTGYFVPGIPGSRKPSERFGHPVYGRPDDLVEVHLSAFDLSCGPKTLIGRQHGKTVTPYFSRREIDAGVLDGRADPIAWVSDPVALFFLHVQGSGTVHLEDGGLVHLHYAISNGLPYKSIGRYLIDKGKSPPRKCPCRRSHNISVRTPMKQMKYCITTRAIFFSPKGHTAPVGASVCR